MSSPWSEKVTGVIKNAQNGHSTSTRPCEAMLFERVAVLERRASNQARLLIMCIELHISSSPLIQQTTNNHLVINRLREVTCWLPGCNSPSACELKAQTGVPVGDIIGDRPHNHRTSD